MAEELVEGLSGASRSTASKVVANALETRPYQARILALARKYFIDDQLRSLLIDSPTGSGKTIMGLLIAKQMQDQLGLSVGWVAMRRHLLAQASEENERKKIGLRASWISMFDKSPPPSLDLLVVDEAQHDAAQSMAHLHNVIQPRYILGLSATPFRTDRIKLCFDKVIKEAGIHRLIQDGYLSPFHHYTIPEYTPEYVATMYADDPKRWGKSILYFHTLEQCQRASETLIQRGIPHEVVTGSSDRESQIDTFRSGQTHVLINCMVLAEGFDCPELKTVFCRPSGCSITVQMCGRVFRKHPDHPFKQIVQCQQTRWPFHRTADPVEQYSWMEGRWKSLTLNRQIQEISLRAVHALAQCKTELPPFLTKQAKRRSQAFRGRNTDFSEIDFEGL